MTRFFDLLRVTFFLSNKLENKIRFRASHTTYGIPHLLYLFSTSYGIFCLRMFHLACVKLWHRDSNWYVINQLIWRLVSNRLLNLLANRLSEIDLYNMQFLRVKYFSGLILFMLSIFCIRSFLDLSLIHLIVNTIDIHEVICLINVKKYKIVNLIYNFRANLSQIIYSFVCVL